MSTSIHCPHCGGLMPADVSRCPFCGGRRSVAITAAGGLPPVVADASDAALATELQQTLFPDIVVLRELGRGGMGLVFLAREPALRRLVVIKVLAPELAQDAAARSRFRREAEAAAAVAHPNVVAVHQAGELPRSGTAYLVMQFIDGPTLAEEFPPGSVAPEARAKRVMGEVAAALAAAHARGLIHRDIKPANIMIERETGRAVVLDFGVTAARGSAEQRSRPRITQEGVMLGTPTYMSPEQAAAEPVTDRSDVYSLGVVMFELVIGRAPFEERTPVALAAAHLHKMPPLVTAMRPDLDLELATLMDRCLAKRPAERPDAAEIARILMPATVRGIEWPPPGLGPLHGAGRAALREFRLVAAVAFGFFVVLATVGAAFAGPGWVLTASGFLAAVLALDYIGERAALRAGRWGIAGRQAGYPANVLLDVALDPRHDAGALRNGIGPFAVLPEETRAARFRSRRWASATVCVGLVLTIIGVVMWLLGWIAPNGGTGLHALSLGGAVALFAPWIIAECAAAVMLLSEFKLRVAPGRRREFLRRALRAPSVRTDLATGWLADADLAPAAPLPRGRAILIRWGAWVWGLPTAALALTVLVLALSTGRNTLDYASDLDRWRQWSKEFGPPHTAPTPWQRLSGALDRVLQGFPDTVSDTAAILALAQGASSQPAWGARYPFKDTVTVAWAVIPASLPPSILQVLRQDQLPEEIATFRRVVRYRPEDLRWIAGRLGNSPWARASFSSALLQAAWRDGAAAASDFVSGHRSDTRTRALELLAVTRWFLLLPDARNSKVALPLGQLGARMLQVAARGPADLRSASDISEGLGMVLGPNYDVPMAGALRAAADADSTRWVGLVGDRALAPQARLQLYLAFALGGCQNQRERFSGPSQRRKATLHALPDAVADLPAAPGVVRFAESMLGGLRNPLLTFRPAPGYSATSGVEPADPLLRFPDLFVRPGWCDGYLGMAPINP